MSDGRSWDGAKLTGRWLWICFKGWLLGFAFIIVIVLLSELFAIGDQYMVGVGMGAGVGLLQGRFLKPWLGSSGRWWLSTTAGMGGPFVFHDLVESVGLDAPYSLPLHVAAGALLVGLLQWLQLRRRVPRSGWWVPVNLVGWGLPVGLLLLGEPGRLPEPWSTIGKLLGMLFGGGILGAVTGPVLARFVKRAPGTDAAT